MKRLSIHPRTPLENIGRGKHAPMLAKSQSKQANKERKAIYILTRNPSSNIRNKQIVKSIFIQANL